MVPAALPIPRSVPVEMLLRGEEGRTIRATSAAAEARCPVCGEPSRRLHRRYRRTLADLPWAGVTVRMHVQARTCFGDHDACPRQSFAERLVGIAATDARRPDRQREVLTAIAFAAGGEAGARLAEQRGRSVRPDPRRRLIRRGPEHAVPTPAGLGVDDWAIPKGLTDGTILLTASATARLTGAPTAPAAAWRTGCGRIRGARESRGTAPGPTPKGPATAPRGRPTSPTAGPWSPTWPIPWQPACGRGAPA